MNAERLTNLAEVALAGYGSFVTKGPPASEDLEALNGDLAGFSILQARAFTARFEVAVPTFNDATSATGSGTTSFDATVFQASQG